MKRDLRRRSGWLTLATVAVFSVVASGAAFAQQYTFKVVASTETHGGAQFQIGDLNNNGQFDFNIVGATKDNPGGGEAHYVYDGTNVVLVHPSSAKLPDGSTPTAGNMWTPMGINDQGHIVYVADTDGSPHAIVMYDIATKQYTIISKNDTVVEGGTLTSAGVSLEGRMVADINNKDQVVWSEGLTPADGSDATDAVFMYDPTTKKITTIARKGTALPGGKQVMQALFPNINELGEIVFMANTADDENYGVYQWANGNITAIATPGTKVGDVTLAQAKLPRNADGYVVFRGELVSSGGAAPVADDTGYFLYTTATGQITKIVAPGDALPGGKFVATEGNRRAIGVNKNGQVVFKATMENEAQGIFLWKGGTITKLITSGETLESSFKVDGIVQGLGGQTGYHLAINDFGDVAFTAVSGDTHAAILATAPR
jgi:hypothetical protein